MESSPSVLRKTKRPACIDDLPVELCLKIVQEINDIPTMATVLSVSSGCRRAFEMDRNIIFPALVSTLNCDKFQETVMSHYAERNAVSLHSLGSCNKSGPDKHALVHKSIAELLPSDVITENMICTLSMVHVVVDVAKRIIAPRLKALCTLVWLCTPVSPTESCKPLSSTPHEERNVANGLLLIINKVVASSTRTARKYVRRHHPLTNCDDRGYDLAVLSKCDPWFSQNFLKLATANSIELSRIVLDSRELLSTTPQDYWHEHDHMRRLHFVSETPQQNAVATIYFDPWYEKKTLGVILWSCTRISEFIRAGGRLFDFTTGDVGSRILKEKAYRALCSPMRHLLEMSSKRIARRKCVTTPEAEKAANKACVFIEISPNGASTERARDWYSMTDRKLCPSPLQPWQERSLHFTEFFDN